MEWTLICDLSSHYKSHIINPEWPVPARMKELSSHLYWANLFPSVSLRSPSCALNHCIVHQVLQFSDNTVIIIRYSVNYFLQWIASTDIISEHWCFQMFIFEKLKPNHFGVFFFKNDPKSVMAVSVRWQIYSLVYRCISTNTIEMDTLSFWFQKLSWTKKDVHSFT